MLELNKLEASNSFQHFGFVNSAKTLTNLFTEKNTDKFLKMIKFNDAFLKRQTVFAINYNDGEKFAQFCLI